MAPCGRRLIVLCTALLMFFGGACCPVPRDALRRAYRGPTEPISQVVAAVNTNNKKLTTVWARGAFRAWVPDEKKRLHYVDGDLSLQYRKPQDLRLIATKVGVGSVIDLGSSDRFFWCIVKPEVDTIWFGDYTKAVRNEVEMPIRPDLILDVLGIGDINNNFLAQPMPVMKFINEQDVYSITWHRRLPDRLAAEKEIWYDRKSKLPIRVLLYDENGRLVLQAKLSNHRPVEFGDLPKNQSPQLATAYDLYFPDSDAKMLLNLETAWDSHNGFPKDSSFRMPPPRNAADHVIDLNQSPEAPPPTSQR